jgi:hypothetical protein
VEAVQPGPTEAPIVHWVINDIKRALSSRGLTSMAERQHAVEAAVERPVDSLRSLTRAEALRVLSLLASPPPQTGRTSSWDERDEATWIDRL